MKCQVPQGFLSSTVGALLEALARWSHTPVSWPGVIFEGDIHTGDPLSSWRCSPPEASKPTCARLRSYLRALKSETGSAKDPRRS